MAYKRYNNKRRFRRRRPYRKPRRYQVADAAYKGYKLARKLARVVNVEYKVHENSFSTAPSSSGSSLFTINTISQGDTDLTRDGDSIKLMNLSFKGHMIFNTSASSSMARIIVFWDQANKITSINDVLSGTWLGTTNAAQSMKNYDKRFLSKILYDKVVSLDASNSIKQFSAVIPINKHTQYEAGTTVINNGALKVCLVSNESVNFPAVQWLYRLTYVDN